jgi:hypothetical protein
VHGTLSQQPAALKQAAPYGAQTSSIGGGATHCPAEQVPLQVRPQVPQL